MNENINSGKLSHNNNGKGMEWRRSDKWNYKDLLTDNYERTKHIINELDDLYRSRNYI